MIGAPNRGRNLLRDLLDFQTPGINPEAPMPMAAPMSVPEQPKKPGFMAPGSKGAMIAGIIGDALAAGTGGQPVFTANMMAQRQREADAQAAEAQWHRNRQANREDKQWEWQNKPPEVPSMVRDAQAWDSMPPHLRKAYQEMNDADRGPFTFLPNGQVWARDPALMQQFGGGSAQTPQRNLGPVVDTVPGGPASAPGNFRR